MNCELCGIEFESKRSDAKYCSLNCRVTASRKGANVTDNVTLSSPGVTLNLYFSFYTVTKGREPLKGQRKEADEKSSIRKAKYWYDVPLGAIPIIKKGWPEIPDYMNGRQYFLWWKNEFAVGTDQSKGNVGGPIIFNPFNKEIR